MKTSNLYHYGYERIYTDVPKKTVSKGVYLTDRTFFVPSTELSKVQSTYDQFNGAFDSSIVPDELIDIRRPGNDITETSQLVDSLKTSFENSMEVTKSELSEKAINDAKASAEARAKDEYLNSVMTSSHSDNT